MRIIQFTDTHLVEPGETLKGLDPKVRLDIGIAHAMERFSGADLWVITGDLTNEGTTDAYKSLKATLAPITDPLQLMIGNHDDRQNFCTAFPDTSMDGQGFVQSVLDYEQFRLIFLDTNEPGTPAGVYCDKRANWLQSALDGAGERDIYLFMHHPPFAIGIPRLDQMSLDPESRFFEIVEGRGNIRHIFFGHVHRPVSGQWKGISYSALKGTNHQVELNFETPKLIYALELPSYAVIDLEPGHTRVHLMDYEVS